jgi:hypothetical protein
MFVLPGRQVQRAMMVMMEPCADAAALPLSLVQVAEPQRQPYRKLRAEEDWSSLKTFSSEGRTDRQRESWCDVRAIRAGTVANLLLAFVCNCAVGGSTGVAAISVEKISYSTVKITLLFHLTSKLKIFPICPQLEFSFLI